MPDFYEKMKTRLRTTEEGADTIIWLALSEAALKQPSGLFYQGRYSKTSLKRPLEKNTKNCFQDRLWLNARQKYCLMEVESIAECFKRAFCNTFDLH